VVVRSGAYLAVIPSADTTRRDAINWLSANLAASMAVVSKLIVESAGGQIVVGGGTSTNVSQTLPTVATTVPKPSWPQTLLAAGVFVLTAGALALISYQSPRR
jgi:hypothetical protein